MGQVKAMSDIQIKDFVFLIVGLIIGVPVGIWIGIALYWCPLGQFLNEQRALWNLVFKRYRRGDSVTVRAGAELNPVNPVKMSKRTENDCQMVVCGDEGIGWHHTGEGWKRSRILHVCFANDTSMGGLPVIYKACHFYVAKKQVLS